MTVAVVGRLGAWQTATIAAANPGRVAVASVTPALAVAPVGRLGQWQADLFARSPWSPMPAMPSYIPSAPAPIPAPPVAPPPPVAAPPAPPPPPPPAPPVAPAPSPVAPAPVPVAPAPAPVAPTPSAPAAGPLATALAGVRAGARFRLADGTKVKGYSVSGSASVQSFDGKTLTLRLDASAAFGFVQKKIALKVEDVGNGKMKVVANELNGQGQAKEQLYAGTLEVVGSSKGRLTLRTPEGEQGSLVVRPDGGLELASPLGTFVMAAA